MMFKVDSELMNVFETDWYKKVKAATSPGDNLKIYGEIMAHAFHS